MFKFVTKNKIQNVDRFGIPNTYEISVAIGIIDMSVQSGDYRTDSCGFEPQYVPEFFYIVPETNGDIVVELAGMSEGAIFTITATQILNKIGTRMPYRIRKVVKSGTTATFSVVW